MKIGYARVSTLDQNPELQHDALKAAGCEKVFVDTISGAVAVRPGLEKVKEHLRSGDMLVVMETSPICLANALHVKRLRFIIRQIPKKVGLGYFLTSND